MRNEDKVVGALVKSRRQLIGKSQGFVADKLGISFQQLQKYESGANRISISRLCDIADVLKVNPSYFLEMFNDGEPDNLRATTIPEARMLTYMRGMTKSSTNAILSVAQSLEDDHV